MTKSSISLTSVFSILLGLSMAGEAQAITVPTTGTCNTGGKCLEIVQDGLGSGGISSGAIYGKATSANSVPVWGEQTSGSGTNPGVYGYSLVGPGVQGNSGSYNGVLGRTNSLSSAAISAVSPSSSGLAFWGGGGIMITGSYAEKAGGGSWSAPSDARLKKDVVDFDQGLVELMQVRPILYKYNGLGGTSDDGREYVGVIAQELERVAPAMVSSTMAKLNNADADDTEIKRVDPSAFTYMLINAVQEQQAVIERQEARIAALEKGGPRIGSLPLSLGTVGAAAAFGLLPVGLALGTRGRKEQKR